MRRPTIMIAATSVLMAATRVESQSPRDSVVAAVNEFFHAMTARDTAALGRVLYADGILYAARVQGDSAAVRRGTFEGFAQQIAGLKETYVERMWEPTVLVHGPLAIVWAAYDFHRDKVFSHCGIDAFTLLRSPTGWKIATVSYTTEATGCKPSPLGPVK